MLMYAIRKYAACLALIIWGSTSLTQATSTTHQDLSSPYEVKCPNEPLIRIANGDLCSREIGHLQSRSQFLRDSFAQFLKGLDLVNFDSTTISKLSEEPPMIGVAISGGGYRSMLTASGVFQEMNRVGLMDCVSYIAGVSGGAWLLMDLVFHGFDIEAALNGWNFETDLLKGISDFYTPADIDFVSGIDYNVDDDNDDDVGEDYILKRETLQVASKWSVHHSNENDKDLEIQSFSDFLDKLTSVTSVTENTRKSMTSLGKRAVDDVLDKLREFLFPGIVSGNGTTAPEIAEASKHIREILNFYIQLHLEVRPKKVRGFPISFTDYWGKALLKRFKGSNGEISRYQNTTSLATLFSQSGQTNSPIPIFVSNCKNNHLKNVIFEITPFEFGSWGNVSNLFVDLQYLGSEIVAGDAVNCYKGFDDIGFITGTSSSIFNNVIVYMWQLLSHSSRRAFEALGLVLGVFGLTDSTLQRGLRDNCRSEPSTEGKHIETNYAVYYHNPFFRHSNGTSKITEDTHLYLVDGGEDGENIPLRPLLIPERQLDVILLIDSSSDVENYPNGTKLRNVIDNLGDAGRFYNLPDNLTSLDLRKPVILGCNPIVDGNGRDLPAIIYFANANHGFESNTSTFKVSYNRTEVDGMLNNGRNVFSYDGDVYFRNCLACVFLRKRRHLGYMDGTGGTDVKMSIFDSFCSKCYQHFCYS